MAFMAWSEAQSLPSEVAHISLKKRRQVCASDHAMNAIDEMSALNRDLKKFFDENGVAYPVWQALEAEAGRYLQ